MTTRDPLSPFPSLPAGVAPAGARRLRVCIASCEFIGPIRNGGIGTAYTAMARSLAAAGHDVTLFYTQGQHCENENFTHWRTVYQKEGLKLVARPSDPKLHIDAPELATRSYETYLWLKSQSFDLVHFPEWSGDAYYSLQAKHQGLAFQHTLFCIGTHSPNAWLKQANSEHYAHPLDLEVDFMERRCVALADIVVSPCQYMLHWMLENGFELPARSYVQQNILPASARGPGTKPSDSLLPVSEIVFFGRLETRKGIELFCDALDRLAKEPAFGHLKITFMGKPATINGCESRAYIENRAAQWPWPRNIISDLDQPGAMRYLKQPGRLAVIPSLMENSPYTVLECLGSHIPFLASRVGGISELISDDDVAQATFRPSAAELAGLLSQTLKAGIRPWKPAVEAAASETAWMAGHEAIRAECIAARPTPVPLPEEKPLVTVCIAHFNRPHFLKQSLASLEAQDYPNFEVIVVDDGSTSPEAIQYLADIEPGLKQRNWRIIRQENRYLSAARNTGARHARGEYLMFMDDDNFAKPEEISTFVKVARHTGADIVTASMDYFEGTEQPRSNGKPVTRWVPLGPDAASGFYRNVFGDANCLVRRSTFEKLGGFTEIHGVTHEDWEFLANAVLKGCHLEVIPEALFHYRFVPDSMIRSTSKYRNHLRHIRPYLDAIPPAMHQILRMAQGAWISESTGRARARMVTELSLKWRSQFEAANILAGLGHEKAAGEMFLTALNSATATNHSLVILEAMLDIGRGLRKFDAGRGREILRLAVQLGEKTRCPEAVRKAEALLAEAPGTNVPAKITAEPTRSKPIKTLSTAAPVVSIIIPTFNNLPLTQSCLESLTRIPSSHTFEIIVVDNASTDGSLEFLREQEKDGRIRLVINSRNEGFACACNQGARDASGTLLLFLNNDTKVTTGWLNAMVHAARRPHVGVVGAKLLYADDHIQHAGIGFINDIPDHPHRHASADAPEVSQFRELDMVTGACLLIQRGLFFKLAGFDEAYRNGVEDIDLCLRARAAGWKVVYEPRAVVYHLEGQSAGRFSHVSENLRIFFERWGKSFDAQKRFIAPRPARIMAASHSLLLENAKQIPVAWIGSFLDHGSLSHVNREFTRALKSQSQIELHCVTNGATIAPGFEKQAHEISPAPPAETAVTVRHAWPPDWKRPATGQLVVIQPWEFGALPEQWVKDSTRVDEFWVPSEYVRHLYVESGVRADKVRVVPNGVDPEKFNPQFAPMKLATEKRFKFLFVGGTIFRKGPDLLLKAFLDNFTAADEVCLVIKDFGGKTVYAGQTFESQIQAAKSQPNAPEILHLNEELSPDSLPGLYTACDCLVLPYRGEGFGLPVLEAMACGLPVIVTAGGATDDFVRDDFAWRIPAERRVFGREVSGLKLAGAGWLLEPDAASLGRAMREAFTNPPETRRRGELAARHARQFYSWQNAAAMAAQRIRELALRPPEPAKSTLPQKSPASRIKITLPPCALVGHLAAARELVRQKKFRAAGEAALAVLARRPFHPEAALLLAEIAQSVGDGRSARLCAEHARRIAPEWKPAKKFLNQRLKDGARPEWLKLPEFINPPSPVFAPKLSVCLIVRNEEKFLGQCLKSIRDLASQIVVVDTGSTDRTAEIAKEHGAEVHDFPWCDDFSAARNTALEHATGDWVLMLDADEELSAEGREKLKTAMTDPAVMAWRLPIVDVGREADGCSYVPRFYRNAPGLFYVGRVHEQVFSSLEVRRAEWGLENRIGDATLIHHGYTAELTRDRNKVERNLKLLERAVAELPDEPHLLMNLGLELARSGRETEALERYQEAFRVLSSKPAAEIVPELRETLLMQLCARLTAAKRFDEVVSSLASSLAGLNGGLTSSLHFSLGLAHLELRQFSEAADQMRQCLAKRGQRSLAPINREINTAAPYHCLALSLARSGDVAGAEKAFQQGLTETGHGDALRLDYARFLAGQNRPLDALQRLNEVVAENKLHLGAWQLGGQIALSRPEFLEFARDWTGEAMQHVPKDPMVMTHRAEALMLSEDVTGALELWDRVWNLAPQPDVLGALILCETVESLTTHAPSEGQGEMAVSRAFIEWYRKLMAVKAHQTIVRLNEQTDKLARALPGASRLLEAAMAEASRVRVASV